MGNAFLTGQSGGKSSNLGTLTVTGSYASASYYTASGCMLGENANGNLFLTIQSGTSASYENIIFSVSSVPSGVTFLGQTITAGSALNSSNSTQNYFTAVFSGLTGKVNVTVSLDGLNSTYDYVSATVTITNA